VKEEGIGGFEADRASVIAYYLQIEKVFVKRQ